LLNIYSEGLAFYDNETLLESSGGRGKSTLHLLTLSDMSIKQEQKLAAKYFGEGADIVVVDNSTTEIFQLTYRERAILVYDVNTLLMKRTMDLPIQIKEGWGLTKRWETVNETKVQYIYITDGSSNIFVCDPKTMEIKKTLQVKDKENNDMDNLNELEFVKDKLWAN